MKLKNLLSVALATLAIAPFAGATTVAISASRAGPLVITSNNTIVDGGLVRVGMLTGVPASNSVADISAVFQEFDNYTTNTFGGMNTSVVNVTTGATSFNGGLIHLWVFDMATPASSTEHALFTNPNPAPTSGEPWVYPVNTFGIGDGVTIDLRLLPTDGDASFTPGVQFQASLPRIILTPIPEPTAPALVICAAVLAISSRRHR